MQRVGISMEDLTRAYNKVRKDLADVGLLKEDKYLDGIECWMSSWIDGLWERAYVYDAGTDRILNLMGWFEGVIYVPFNATVDVFTPGNTLVDTIRHEYGHAWAWLDLEYVDRPWFARTFGGEYHHDKWTADEKPDYTEEDFVSRYACTNPKEDFAETFMFYLKYRNNLDRFAKSRPGVYRKLKAVEKVVKAAARSRVDLIDWVDR